MATKLKKRFLLMAVWSFFVIVKYFTMAHGTCVNVDILTVNSQKQEECWTEKHYYQLLPIVFDLLITMNLAIL